MLKHPYVGPIMLRLRPTLIPDVDYICEDRDGATASPLRKIENWPSQVEVDAEAPAYLTDLGAAQAAKAAHDSAKTTRRAQLRAFRDGTGNLTAAQLTALLRALVREVLGDD